MERGGGCCGRCLMIECLKVCENVWDNGEDDVSYIDYKLAFHKVVRYNMHVSCC
jgi:hypothetical protein